MIRAFLESIKYMGHLWPVALVRMILGIYYISWGSEKLGGDYLNQPYMSESIRLGLQQGHAPEWYQYFFEVFLQQNWQLFTYAVSYTELFIGISYLLGLFTRPFAVLGMALTMHSLWTQGFNLTSFYQILFLFHLLLFLLGAGRCLGMDYYFFRSRRGLWW